MIIQFKNVTCIIGEMSARNVTANFLTKEGYQIVKILPDVFFETSKAMMMKPNFPSAFRFERNMNRIKQYGFEIKWTKNLFPSALKEDLGISLMQDQSTLLVVLRWILVFGYLVSIITFLSELIVKIR